MKEHGRKTASDRDGLPVMSRRYSELPPQRVNHFGRRMRLGRLALGLIAVASLIPTGRARAQTFVNADGAYPQAKLLVSGNMLYGAAAGGGSSGGGTLFAARADGSGFTILHNFTYYDGINPHAGLTNVGNMLYGTAFMGGTWGNGTVFAVNTDGTGFTNLYSFTSLVNGTNSDGMHPGANLLLFGSTLYGTTGGGGTGGSGVVFAINTDGSGFTILHSFAPAPFRTNADGMYPQSLALSGCRLYGAAALGGGSCDGTIFALNIDGTGFTNLHTFGDTDGAYPYAGLVLSGNTLYGTTQAGGTSDNGTVFALNTDGGGFTNLHSFTANPYETNSDGAYPYGNLVLSSNRLYGTTEQGGSSGSGTVFALNTTGAGFGVLYNFTAAAGQPQFNTDGANPVAGVLLAGNTLFGTAFQGGSAGDGTLFRINTDGSGFTNLHSFTTLSLPLPQLKIALSGTNVLLTWGADFGGLAGTVYTLQSTTNPALPAAWTYFPFTSSVLNGDNTVSQPVAATTEFYRLSPLNLPCTGNSDCPPGYHCDGTGRCAPNPTGGGGGGGGGGGCAGGCPCGVCVGGFCAANGIGAGCGGFAAQPPGIMANANTSANKTANLR